MEQRSASATVTFVTPARLEIKTWAGKRRYDVEVVELSAARAGVVALEELLVGTEVQLLCGLPTWNRRLDLDVGAVIRWRTAMRAEDMILGRDCYVYGLELRPTPQQEHQLIQSVFFIQTMQRAMTASNAEERADAGPSSDEPAAVAGMRPERRTRVPELGNAAPALSTPGLGLVGADDPR